MTDFSRYKNVTLGKAVYKKLDKLQTILDPVKMSKSQTVTLAIDVLEYVHQNKKVAFEQLQQRIETLCK